MAIIYLTSTSAKAQLYKVKVIPGSNYEFEFLQTKSSEFELRGLFHFKWKSSRSIGLNSKGRDEKVADFDAIRPIYFFKRGIEWIEVKPRYDWCATGEIWRPVEQDADYVVSISLTNLRDIVKRIPDADEISVALETYDFKGNKEDEGFIVSSHIPASLFVDH